MLFPEPDFSEQNASNVLGALNFSLQESLQEPAERKYSKPGLFHSIAILDEFSFMCFDDYLNLWAVEPNEVEGALRNLNPKFLFVESAWSGNNGAWRYMVTSQSGPKPPLKKLIALCRKLDIPTVFWNKEDPPHFDDFIETAKLFDFVYTTEGSLLDTYKANVGHPNVSVMQFAASPKLHNPKRVTNFRDGDVAFAGQYFRHKFPERREQMDILFTAASKFNFSIFSRVLGGDLKYQFPSEYERFIKGSLPYHEMVAEYKRHKIFLNINSVVNSKTMCARRVYELAATKTNVVSLKNQAIELSFGREAVSLVDNRQDEIAEVMASLIHNEDLRLQRAQNAWRIVADKHLYSHRVDQINNDLGITTSSSLPVIGIVISCRATEFRSSFVESIREQISQLKGKAEVRLYLTGTDTSYIREALSGLVKVEIFRDTTDLLENSRGLRSLSYVAVMRADRYYGSYHLWDLLHVLKYFSDETIVSKTSILADDRESVSQYVYSGGWLCESTSSSLAHLLLSEEKFSGNQKLEVDDFANLTDDFSFSDNERDTAWRV